MSERAAKVWRWRLGALLMVILAMLGGCDGCAPEAPPVGEAGALALGKVVPQSAQAVVFAEKLTWLETMLEGVKVRLEGVVEEGGFAEDAGELGEIWQVVGAGEELPAVAYVAHGQLVVAGWRQEGGRVPDPGAIWGLEAKEQDHEKARGARWYDDAGRFRGWSVIDRRRWAVGWFIDAEGAGEGARGLDEIVMALGTQALEVGAHREFLASSAERRLSAMIAAGALARGLGGEGHAGVLAQRLARELGWVHVRGGLDETRERVELEVATPGAPGLASGMIDFGRAEGELPMVGGLVRPGVLGVARLSGDPGEVVRFVLGALSSEDRQGWERWVKALEEDLRVDVMNDAIGQLAGQAMVVVYGLENAFFEQEGVEAWASLVRLKTTRDAVLLPIKERRPVEDMLNSLTQISRGKLQRQVIRHMIQYAWLEDGELKWALILGDDHVLLVDSVVAFDHANRWERSAQPLGEGLARRGVDALLEGVEGGGVYVELGALRGIFEEKGREDLARWLTPVEALSVRAGEQGRADRAEVRLWLGEAWAGGPSEAGEVSAAAEVAP
ncbi:hypothetical protein DL240_07300 [Lujinxingia litoralis]|uniref:Uncharacterized protein n=1 Tax=Lujinxingia litoralis TaxID=2211119 RepID=A0A328C9D0_9DELT|nr:hypothetical protein [Lujinxingia litoralis]RAL23946.1 hypothetical protein DL240_07300 [Lujinxingia litoralis]